MLTGLFICVLLMGFLALPVSAESAASRVDSYCTVNSEGDCLVSMTVTLRLEAVTTGMTFPLPANATGITLNGASVSTDKTSSAIRVDISRVVSGVTGEIPLSFNFTIPEAVKVVKINDERKLQLDIQLLSGFELPVERLDFVITMPPGEITSQPKFTSIYRQESIASDLSFTVSSNQIIGSSKTILNDHEGITMTMLVDQKMFPSVSTYIREGNPEIVPMLICAGLALLYWLIFLRTKPIVHSRSITPPEGITAGEMGCRLTLSGSDLTMMVFTWAQLGYLLIQVDDSGRVLLHKRMDMGNERSLFENKIFGLLFGSRRTVDATGYPYARLCRKVLSIVPNERNMYKGVSGNMKIFRGLCSGTQIFCGICVAMNMTSILALQILLSIILGAFGAVSAWLIQDMAYRTHLRGKVPVYIGLVCVLIWIALGLLCGQVWIPLCSVLGELLLGYFAAYGGRRSDLGHHVAAQVLGFRRYAKHLPREDVGRLMTNDPDYFFNLAPYALALGVINPFARAFGRRKLDQCPYLVTRVRGSRTAEEWARLMADTADRMDEKSRRMEIEKWTAVRLRFRR
ncbi:MAG: DUF2207 family protein [Faecousia sp.]